MKILKQLIGGFLLALPFLGIFFVGWIVPGAPNWAGALALGMAAIIYLIIRLGLKLLSD